MMANKIVGRLILWVFVRLVARAEGLAQVPACSSRQVEAGITRKRAKIQQVSGT